MWTSAADAPAPARSPSSSLDVEFEYGRRIDEIIAAPGAVTRISVGVVVPDAISDERRAKVTELVRVAAGLDERRGDALTVQPLSQIDLAAEIDSADTPRAVAAGEVAHNANKAASFPANGLFVIGAALAAVVLLVLMRRRAPASRALSEQERQSILDDIQRALSEESASTRGHERP
jgi:flagellar M-ring protein FliF